MKQSLAAGAGLIIQAVISILLSIFILEDLFVSVGLSVDPFLTVTATANIICAFIGSRIAHREGGNVALIAVGTLIFGLGALLAFLVSDSPQKIRDSLADQERRRVDASVEAAMRRREANRN